jgi:hypothetical protein
MEEKMIFPNNWFSKIIPLVDPKEFTIVGSISQLSRAPKDLSKTILYNWDVYPWMDYTQGNWKVWGEMMKHCYDVWHASECTLKRTEEIYGLKKGKVIKMFVPTDWLDSPVSNKRFVLMPMRHYTQDKTFLWAKRACEELNIPLVHPNHDLAPGKFKELMHTCTLVLSHYTEASTGGQGLIEASYLNKPVLINDSFYNGGREHVGNRGFYFKTYDELKLKLLEMFFNPPKLSGGKEWVKENYDISVMAKEMNKTICAYT